MSDRLSIHEILEAIPDKYPQHELLSNPPRNVMWDGFQLKLENDWIISVGYGRRSYSQTRVEKLDNPRDATYFEIGIFRPNGDWFLVEGMNVQKDAVSGSSGVLGFEDSDRLFTIIEYIARYDPKPPPEVY